MEPSSGIVVTDLPDRVVPATGIFNDIARECPKSIILPGIAVNGAVAPEEVANWLETIGYQL